MANARAPGMAENRLTKRGSRGIEASPFSQTMARQKTCGDEWRVSLSSSSASVSSTQPIQAKLQEIALMSNARRAPMPWFARGDIDGFFGLALDNFVQLLLIAALCKGVLNFDDALLYGRVLPGAAISILAGNLFYA